MNADHGLLMQAHAIYLAMGRLPFDVAAKLMERGYIVEELESRWDRLPLEAE